MSLVEDKKTILLIIAIVVVGVLGVYAYNLALKGGKPAAPGTAETQVETVPVPKVTVSIKTAEQEVKRTRQTINLIAVAGGEEKGTATRSYTGSDYMVTAVGMLPSPGAGNFYMAWLESDTASPSRLMTEKLGLADPGQYAVVFSTANDVFQYNRMIITLETNDDDQPETTVLEGAF